MLGLWQMMDWLKMRGTGALQFVKSTLNPGDKKKCCQYKFYECNQDKNGKYDLDQR